MSALGRVGISMALAAGALVLLPSNADAAAPAGPAIGTVYVAEHASGDAIQISPGDTEGDFAGGYSSLSGTAVDAAGNVYLADTGEITEVPESGDRPFTIGSGWDIPTGIAVDPAGDVYVVDQGLGGVYRVAAGSGTKQSIGTGLANPLAVAVDPVGDVYIVESGNGAGVSPSLVKLPADGGAQTTTPLPFDDPDGVAVDSAGDVYVSDPNGDEVVEIEAGVVTGNVGKGLHAPSGLALDAAGNLYISELGTLTGPDTYTNGGIVEVLASDHAQGVLYKDDNDPVGLSVYAPPPTFTADSPPTIGTLNGKYDGYPFSATVPNGELAPTFTVASGELPRGIQLTSSGLLTGVPTAAGFFTFTVAVANSVTGSVTPPITIAIPSPTLPAPPALGTVFVADPGGGYIVELPPGGTPIPIGYGFTTPTGVAVDAQGDLFVADSAASSITELPAGGGTAITLGSSLDHPVAVAVDAAGDLDVADQGNGSDGAVVTIPHGGTQANILTSIAGLDGLALDAHGDLYYTTSNTAEELRVGATTPSSIDSGLSEPNALTVDASGDVLIANGGGDDVVEVPAGGGSPQTVLTDVDGATGLALDASGNLFVSDRGSDQVVESPAVGGSVDAIDPSIWRAAAGVAAYAAPPTFTSDTPPSGRVGTEYSYPFQIESLNGEPPVTITLAAGTVPPGLTLNPSTGVLSGTPTTSGSFTFTVKVANAAQATLTPTITVVIAARPVITVPLGTVFESTIGGTVLELSDGGSTTVTDPDGYPNGLALDNAGNLYIANESSGQIERVSPAGATTVLVHGLEDPLGVAVGSGGAIYVANTNANRVELVPSHGAFKNIGTGLKSPTAVAVDAAGDVFIADAAAGVVEVSPSGAQKTIATNIASPSGLMVEGNGNLLVASFTGNEIYQITRGSTTAHSFLAGVEQPTQIAENAAGEIYVATADGLWARSTSGIDQLVDSGARDLLGVAVYAPAPTLTSSTPATSATVGHVYPVYTFTSTTPAGEAAPVFGLVAGALPPGLTLNASTGRLAGTPTRSGVYTFTVAVENAGNATGSGSITIKVTGPAYLTTTSLSASGKVGKAYSSSIKAGGYPAPTEKISSGALPAGLKLTASTGAITGTPTKAGTFHFAIVVSNGHGPAVSTRSLTIVVAPKS